MDKDTKKRMRRLETICAVPRIIGLLLIGFFSSWWVALGVFLFVSGTTVALTEGIKVSLELLVDKIYENK